MVALPVRLSRAACSTRTTKERHSVSEAAEKGAMQDNLAVFSPILLLLLHRDFQGAQAAQHNLVIKPRDYYFRISIY
jgi:hypothetical protein